MKIARVFHPSSVYASPVESLRDAAAQMRRHALSCLPVMSQGRLVGILTERDVVEAAAKGVRPSVAHVAEYMNDGGVTVGVDDDIAVAGLKMLAIGCRHLPVMDRGRLVGMVSTRDVFLASARDGEEGVMV
jgi:CBS domain-containing protein